MSESMLERPWFWPLIIGGFLLWTGVVALVAQNDGYQTAMRETAERDQWVSEQMANVGFCAWLKATNFTRECTRRDAALSETRKP